jgi:hypothetical protein
VSINHFAFGFITSLAIGTVVTIPVVTGQLHEATVRQCMMHDWPENQAEAHLKFCSEYLSKN